MKKLSLFIVFAVLTLISSPLSAYAAKQPSSIGTKTNELVGYDVSYVQCGSKLPTGQYFGIVGVNGGNAANTNTCLANELSWANASKTGSSQPKVQLYVNTANPGEVINQITTWPTSNGSAANPYGTCAGANDLACSWQYGWNRASEDVTRLASAAPAAGVSAQANAYTWWLDVETMNTWQSGSADAYARNVATLEGMTTYFKDQGAQVGLYSTAYQWGIITNNAVSSTSNLNGLANWRPSGSSLSVAVSNCTVAPLTTGGFISMTQYVQQSIDKNHSCL